MNLVVFLEVFSLGSFGFNCICLIWHVQLHLQHAACPQIQSLNLVSYNDALIHSIKQMEYLNCVKM
jgi:hypothetical protein